VAQIKPAGGCGSLRGRDDQGRRGHPPAFLPWTVEEDRWRRRIFEEDRR